ncbi:helix-turn-helix transcriptional regulator [Aestuariicoccus sp. MJ-SS9]|uniref:helix-turn-helix domain-containing protein n=1 Tax=Aestuariicoccus sp. MJ-SS9 TaxID=3079855 RepID=UPI002905FD50|nr:helix-turn-helix transcriptional regulator [Aestuariicoccus sp. MJ-SS9]MDU8913506.1 helix-turn-helix transcriptional regulator [Aestuariicoccus sp. MJ-SS9]
MALYGPFCALSMIGGQQIRMARAALRWSIEDLSQHAGIGSRTIKRLEATDEITSANMTTILKIKSCFEYAGIEFIGSPNDRPGIRIGQRLGESDPS